MSSRALPLVVCLSIAASTLCAAVDVNSLPTPTGYVSDLAHVVSADDKEKLEAFCANVEQQLGVQFALVTIDTLGDTPIRQFALDLSRKWGVGYRKTNQGVLLLLVIKDRKNDIETGRGIEPYLTDGFSGSTLRSMRPQLRDGNYGGALLTAAREMASQIAQGKGIAFDDNLPQSEDRQRVVFQRSRGIPWPLVILGIFVLLSLLGRIGRRGGGGGSGCLTWFLLGNLLGGGRGYGGWGGGGWGGGGFGGGSGGGGGFGGFGGGDFGGGGASSSW